ncbi:hypothetical protein VCUG_02235 [Vavraia culicis subsp. floridensis]|uniref:Uncharacterized protein n=1 Tax=Vavraia culicis (isolate floridensis) TaxID=948595 RepID=L2GSJ9_VAVCU|nr:uncharacterized protein VCUG_02235 [Vavraia culicis subsp. floridensis]ELA46268.1 hypothetical protein VCUG_02235 [Vavraia culicis subsp. floridensis]
MKTTSWLKLLCLFLVFFLIFIFSVSYFIYTCHNDSLSRKVLKFNNELSQKHPVARSEVLCIMSPNRGDHYVYYTEKGEMYENIVDKIVSGTHILIAVDLDGCTFNACYAKNVLDKRGMCWICNIGTLLVGESVSVGYNKMIRFLRSLKLAPDVAVFFFVNDYDVVIRVVTDGKEVKRCVVKIGTYMGSRMALRTCLYLFHRCIQMDREPYEL